MAYFTPITKIRTSLPGVGIYLKRDDLLPFSFGGNKVRIAAEYFADMERRKKDCIIGYGRASSNLCRVIANRSRALGYPCHIISPCEKGEERVATNNSRIAALCGAVTHFCSRSAVSQTVSEVLRSCEAAGAHPYYIYGNCFGEGNEAVPTAAYWKAYREILRQVQAAKLHVDAMFLATGSGATQAGLLAGKVLYGGKEEIIGISAARSAQAAQAAVAKHLRAFGQDPNAVQITVLDEFLCGGYGKYSADILQVIRTMLAENGIALDPVYTGKAFYGMLETLKKRPDIQNALFIHTGGTPLFFEGTALF